MKRTLPIVPHEGLFAYEWRREALRKARPTWTPDQIEASQFLLWAFYGHDARVGKLRVKAAGLTLRQYKSAIADLGPLHPFCYC